MVTFCFCALMSLVGADCNERSCFARTTQPRLEWRGHPDEPDRAYLFLDGIQVGGYDRERDEWRAYDARNDAWGSVQRLFDSERKRQAAPTPVLNFGVQRDSFAAEPERHYLNGRPITEAEVEATLTGLELTDDSQRLRLTVIGPEPERKRVLDDLDSHPSLVEWKGQLHVQAYPPEHWAVANTGFVTSGRPTIYLQAPSGRVLHRQDDYRGPERLAEALRRADPHYRPERDPDLNKSFNFDWRRIPTWGWVVAGLVLLTILRKRSTS